jgi:hypothetical protein
MQQRAYVVAVQGNLQHIRCLHKTRRKARYNFEIKTSREIANSEEITEKAAVIFGIRIADELMDERQHAKKASGDKYALQMEQLEWVMHKYEGSLTLM